MCKYFLLALFLFTTSPRICLGQQNYDSLLMVFHQHPTIAKRVEAGLGLTKSLLFRKPDSARTIAMQTLELANKTKNPKDQSSAWKLMGITYSITSSYDTADVCYRQALALSKKANDKLEMAFALNNLGMNAMQAERFDTAINYFYASLRLKESLQDSIEVAKLDIGSTLQNIGIIYHSLQNLEQAEIFYKRAYSHFIKAESEVKMHVLEMEIAGLYYEKGDFQRAISEYKRVASLLEADENVVALAKLYNNLGMALKDAGQLDESIKYLELSLTLNDETGDVMSLAIANSNLAQLYFTQNKVQKALEYALIGYELCTQIGRLRTAMETATLISDIFFSRGDFGKAIVYERSARELNDSLFKESQNQFMIESEAHYQNEKKQAEIIRLNNERILQEELIDQKNRVKNIWIGVAMLLVVLFFVMLRLLMRIRAQRFLLSEQNVQLQALSATKSKLFAVISHDLRNPMHAFNVIARSLSENAGQISASENQYYLNELVSSSEKMLNLLQNLLQWAKVQTGALRIQSERIDLYHLANDVLAMQITQSKAKNIALVNDIPQGTEISADKLILQTVVRNLVSNAVKFTADNGEIHVAFVSFDQYWQLHIIDNGVGMTADEIGLLFSTASIVKEGTMNSEKGSGLGLLICKEMLDLCHARIFVQSVVGKGSTFIIEYPKTNLNG